MKETQRSDDTHLDVSCHGVYLVSRFKKQRWSQRRKIQQSSSKLNAKKALLLGTIQQRNSQQNKFENKLFSLGVVKYQQMINK